MMVYNFSPSTLEMRQHDVSVRPVWFTQAVSRQLGLSWDLQSQKTTQKPQGRGRETLLQCQQLKRQQQGKA